MTACNIWLGPDAGHMIADGAGVDADGRLVVIQSKIIVSEGQNMALMALGYGRIRRVGELLNEMGVDRPDDAVAALPAIGRTIRAENVARGIPAPGLIIVALGWAGSLKRPAAFVCPTDDVQGMKAGSINDVVGYSTPSVDLPFSLESGLLNPDAHARIVLERQRLDFGAGAWGLQTAHTVGGFAEVATVTAQGVSKRKLFDWPEDVIGKPITP